MAVGIDVKDCPCDVPQEPFTAATTANDAFTLLAAVMETVHAPVPEHAPLQPANVCPVLGVAVRVTLVPLG